MLHLLFQTPIKLAYPPQRPELGCWALSQHICGFEIQIYGCVTDGPLDGYILPIGRGEGEFVVGVWRPWGHEGYMMVAIYKYYTWLLDEKDSGPGL